MTPHIREENQPAEKEREKALNRKTSKKFEKDII
jgi:hypothetical protein